MARPAEARRNEGRQKVKKKDPYSPTSTRKRITMKVQVEPCAGHLGLEMPRRFRFGRREIEIVETVDQWDGRDYCYFKIKGNDGNLYILRFEQDRGEWELTMFQSRGAHSTRPEGQPTL
jgi:hypothetical protein